MVFQVQEKNAMGDGDAIKSRIIMCNIHVAVFISGRFWNMVIKM